MRGFAEALNVKLKEKRKRQLLDRYCDCIFPSRALSAPLSISDEVNPKKEGER
jgi:hypothetical protein